MTFGNRLRQARKAKQLTQRELAVKINAKHNSISNWENDQNMPDPETIQNLCWALDVQPNYFFAVEDFLPISHIIPADANNIPIDNIIRIAGRDGSYRERHLTDEQMAALKAILDQMPEMPEDL